VPSIQRNLEQDGVPIVRMTSTHLQVDVAPSVGGRVVSVVERRTGHEFLWRNEGLRLELKPEGSEYDPNFYGGIDELLPNDLAERISGIDCPDHGELWTTPLRSEIVGNVLTLQGNLARSGLEYRREMRLREDGPWVEFEYRVTNTSSEARRFLWKLHAAVAVQEGDLVDCPAGTAQVVDPAWSRFKTREPFNWPDIEGHIGHVIPAKNGTMNFFYLFNLKAGRMFWRRPPAGLKFGYEFDTTVFPYAWLFASYGGFLGHYTIVLEPCTAMPISVNDASALNQCSCLEPGQVLETTVRLYAGPE
jgi:hypothetical protein